MYNVTNFLIPITTTDTNIKIRDNKNNITYTIQKYNCTLTVTDKNLKVYENDTHKTILLPFNSLAEAQEAMSILQTALIQLKRNTTTTSSTGTIITDEDVYRVDLLSKIALNTIIKNRWYKILDGVSGSSFILVKGTSNNTISGFAIDQTNNFYGTYDIISDIFTQQALPINIGTGTIDFIPKTAVIDISNKIVSFLPSNIYDGPVLFNINLGAAGAFAANRTTQTIGFTTADSSHAMYVDNNSAGFEGTHLKSDVQHWVSGVPFAFLGISSITDGTIAVFESNYYGTKLISGTVTTAQINKLSTAGQGNTAGLILSTNGAGVLNWIPNSGGAIGNGTVGVVPRIKVVSGGGVILEYENSNIIDNGVTKTMINSFGNITVDFENAKINSKAGGLSVDAENRSLTDENGNISLTYGVNNRKLTKVNGITVLDYEQEILFTTGLNVGVYHRNAIFDPSFHALLVDLQNNEYYDGNNNLAIRMSSREMFSTSNTSSLDWENKILWSNYGYGYLWGQGQFLDSTQLLSVSVDELIILGAAQQGNTAGYVLTTNGAGQAFWLPGGGGGNGILTISIASANGFNGSSDNDPSNPVLTLGTALNGLLAGDGDGLITASPSDIINALGYIPYDDSNPNGFISNLSSFNTDNLIEGGTNLYFTNQRANDATLSGLNVVGSTINDGDSFITAFGALQSQINSVLGGVTWIGTWDAATNTPALIDGTGTKGYYYIVNNAGLINLGSGDIDFNVGDWAIYDGLTWTKVDNTDAIVSFNNRVGAITLTFTDVTDALGFIPYNEANTSSYISLSSLSGTTEIGYDNLTGVISLNNLTNNNTGTFLKITRTTKGLVSGTSAVTSGDIISALGFTPYNSTNPDGYITGGIQSTNSVYAGPAVGPAAVPSFRALTLSDLPTITVGKGGTNLTTVASGSIIAANSLDAFSAVTSTTGLRVLQNNAGVISWNTSTGTGDNVYSTSPTFITNITTPKIIGGSDASSSIDYVASTNAAPTSTVEAHHFYGGNNGLLAFLRIYQSGQFFIDYTGGAFPVQATKAFVLRDVNNSLLQIGDAGGTPGYTNFWFGTITPTASNYSFQSNGNSFTSLNAPTNVAIRINTSTVQQFSISGVTFTPVATVGGLTQFSFTAAAHTALTASTDTAGILFNMSAIRQFATGAKTDQSEFRITAPTYSAVAATVITNAYTFTVTGSPIAGTNMTITNSFAAWLNGNVRFGSGTTGFFYRPNTLSGLFATFYSTNVTPSNTNHFLMHNGGTTIINATSSGNLQLSIDANAVMIVSSTAITAAQQFTFRTGAAAAGTAPFVLTATSAVLNTTPQAGAMEICSDGQLFFSPIASLRNHVALLGYVAKTTAYQILVTDTTIDCTSGTFTVTLPSAIASVTGVPAGKLYRIKNSGAGVITIATTSSQTIDGALTKTLIVQYGGIIVQSNGANWIVVGTF